MQTIRSQGRQLGSETRWILLAIDRVKGSQYGA
jgi:hypothetical protein